MKKVFLIILASLLLVYTSGWFIAASIAKGKILKTLEDLKAQHIINNYSTTVKIKGFPFNFDISLDSPSFQFDSSNPKSNYNMLYDGTIMIRIGLFSSSIKLITNGDLHLRGTISENKFYLVSTGDERSYRIKLKDFLLSPSLIKQLMKVKGSPNNILNVVDSINIQGKNIQLTNKLTNNYVMLIDKVNIKADVNANISKLQVKYDQELVNAQFSNESLSVWRIFNKIPAISQIVSNINPQVRSYFEVFTFPVLGKMNHSIKLKIDKNANVYDVNIDKFDIKDALEDISVSGTVQNSPVQTKLNISSRKKLTNAYYELLEIYLQNTENKGSILEAFGNIDHHFEKIFGSVFDKQNKRYSIIPVLKELGTIKSEIQLIYKEQTSDSYVDLKKLKIKTDKFVFGAQGQIHTQGDKNFYNFKIDTDDYGYLTDVALNYVDGTQLNKTTLKILDVSLNDAVRHDIKNFIRDVSDNPDARSSLDLSLTIVNKTGGKYPAVGKYNEQEFERKVHTLGLTIASKEIQKKVKKIQDTAKAISNLSQDPESTIKGVLNSLFK